MVEVRDQYIQTVVNLQSVPEVCCRKCVRNPSRIPDHLICCLCIRDDAWFAEVASVLLEGEMLAILNAYRVASNKDLMSCSDKQLC